MVKFVFLWRRGYLFEPIEFIETRSLLRLATSTNFTSFFVTRWPYTCPLNLSSAKLCKLYARVPLADFLTMNDLEELVLSEMEALLKSDGWVGQGDLNRKTSFDCLMLFTTKPLRDPYQFWRLRMRNPATTTLTQP